MQGMDITVQKLCPFVHAHVHYRGVQLRLAHVTLCVQNALVLEPEQAINVVSFLLRCSSYSNSQVLSSNVDLADPCTEQQFKEYLSKR